MIFYKIGQYRWKNVEGSQSYFRKAGELMLKWFYKTYEKYGKSLLFSAGCTKKMRQKLA
jgi:hypothetical protein